MKVNLTRVPAPYAGLMVVAGTMLSLERPSLGDVALRPVAVHAMPAAPGYLYERFDSAAINAEGEVLFWSRLATVATNDECASATEIGPGAVVFSTAGATTSAVAAPCVLARDVWFRFTAPEAGAFHVGLRGANFGSRLAVHRGTCQQPNAALCEPSPINLAAGETIFIRVASAQTSADPPVRGYGTGVLTVWTSHPWTTRGLPLDNAIFHHAAGMNALLLRDGSPILKSDPPLTHFGLELPAWSDAGVYAFAGAISGPVYNPQPVSGLFRGTPEGGAVLIEAEVIPDPPANPDRYLVPPRLDAQGRLAFTHADGAPLVVREQSLDAGVAAPGAPKGVTFARFSQPLAAAPAVAFRAVLTGEGIDDTNNIGLWLDPTGENLAAASLIARTGDAAPGAGEAARFAGLAVEPAINGAGRLTFHARIAGEGIDDTNNTGLWTTRTGSLALLARAGEAAPGVEAGVFSRFSQRPAMNAHGDVALMGAINGEGIDATNNTGIWLFPSSGAPRAVALEGAQVPGLSDGTLFASFAEPVINDAGDIAFAAVVRGDAITYPTSAVLVLVPAGGVPEVVVRAGDEMEVAPGDVRTLGEITFGTSPQGAGRASINNAGQIVFMATFTDGLTAIYTARHVCPADFNDDDQVNSQDFFDFLGAFFGDDPRADFNRDDAVNSQDFFDFLSAFFGPC